MAGPGEALRTPLLDLLGDGLQAVSFSLHLADSFYGELRLVSTLDRVPLQLAAECQDRLRQVSEQVNNHLGTIPIDPYWQKLAVRLPLMVNYLFQQTRIGVSDGCAVMNFVMPPQSAHNLLLASQLTLAAQRGQVPSAVARSMKSGGIEQVLEHRMTLEVPQQSLEFTLQDLRQMINEALPEAHLEIQIQGSDLQQEGITRNQQIRNLQISDGTVSDILTAIVTRANPVAATGPGDPTQRLVWVIDPQTDGPGPRVLITTRSGAERRQIGLPAVFGDPNAGARRKSAGKTLH